MENIECKCPVCGENFSRRKDHCKKSKEKFGKPYCKTCAAKYKGGAGKTKVKGEPVTIVCEFCYSNFIVPFGQRKRKFCSKSCASRARIGLRNSKTRSICVICNKEFEHYGSRILCSRKCNRIYMSQMRIGDNNPIRKTHPQEIRICKECNKEFKFSRDGLHKNQDRFFCSKECFIKFQTGKTKGSWGPAAYSNCYPLEFNQSLKFEIIERDEHSCILCNATKKLSVHHIDYDKTNNNKDNLITLCTKCHGITSGGDRGFFTTFFSAVMSGSKLVKKGWGCEVHIVNNDKYCLKYLIFFKNREFSLHFHEVKQEVWHCLMGKFICEIEENGTKEKFILQQGEHIELTPFTSHRLAALKNSIIVEVSTKDFPEDSIRIEKGD